MLPRDGSAHGKDLRESDWEGELTDEMSDYAAIDVCLPLILLPHILDLRDSFKCKPHMCAMVWSSTAPPEDDNSDDDDSSSSSDAEGNRSCAQRQRGHR